MKMDWEDHRSGTVLRLQGEFVADVVDSFRREIADRLGAGPRLVFDVRSVERLDSAGLEALLWLSEEITRRGGQLRVIRPSGQPLAALQVTRIERRMAMHATLEAAARSLSRGAQAREGRAA
jgi:anti-anti-sigma factor